MTAQFFLAFGIMYAVTGLAFIANPSHIKKTFIAMFKNDALLFFMGFISLLFGVAVLTLHRGIGTPMEIIVTLFGFMALIKGFIYLAFPRLFEKKILTLLKKTQNIRSLGILCVALAALFIWKSFNCGCVG